jgi:hypothetical protein
MDVLVAAVMVRVSVAYALPSQAVKEFDPGRTWKVAWPLPLTAVLGP